MRRRHGRSLTAAYWVDNRRVDSQAMLQAYLKKVSPGDENYGLTVQMHQRRDYGIPPVHLPASVTPIPCSTTSCFRCSVLQGGYSFRWFHPLWQDEYLQLKRRGPLVWTPGETAEETMRLDALFQAQTADHEAMMTTKMAIFHAQVEAAGGLREHIRNSACEAASQQ